MAAKDVRFSQDAREKMLRGSKPSEPAARENDAAHADLAIQAVTGRIL